MPRRTNPFQQLSASIMAVFHGMDYQVTESVLVKNPRTGAVRELDLLVRHLDTPEKNILVECRDHDRKQNVQWIDELEGKAKRLGFGRVIAVSSSGFTKPAIKEAMERNIQTMHLREAETNDWRTWRFGINELRVNVEIGPVVKQLRFETLAEFPSASIKTAVMSQVVLHDTNSKKKIRLMDWISGFQDDPKNWIKFPKPDANEMIQHYTVSIPCSSGFGFVVEPEMQFIPLVQIVLQVDRIRADYRIPLKHFQLEQEKVLVGYANILGGNTKIILREQENKLEVMFEQIGVPTAQFGIDFKKGGQLKVNTTDKEITLNASNIEYQLSKPGIIDVHRAQGRKTILDARTKSGLQTILMHEKIPFDISGLPDSASIEKAEILYDKSGKAEKAVVTYGGPDKDKKARIGYSLFTRKVKRILQTARVLLSSLCRRT